MQATNIIIQQPQPFDLVDRTILIAGYGVGFEGTLSIYINLSSMEYHSHNFMRFFIGNGTFLQD